MLAIQPPAGFHHVRDEELLLARYNTYMTAKLTLSINPAVVSRAKRYAKQEGVSLSRLVEVYLASLTERPPAVDLPPLTASLRGTLQKAGTGAYRKHLVRKYL
jgi:hypothetical protein